MKVAAVIPAYNEEETIGDVVSILRSVVGIDEIVVVSDGSADRTVEMARAAGARVLEHRENMGKASAMKTGFEATGSPVVLFLDADLIGLSPAHVQCLLLPVVHGEADMTVGVFDEGRLSTDLAQLVTPYLSGQRAVRREILTELFDGDNIDGVGFGIEVVMTRHAKDRGYKVTEVLLGEMSHRMKEEKRGLVKGVAARIKMYYEILKYVQKG